MLIALSDEQQQSRKTKAGAGGPKATKGTKSWVALCARFGKPTRKEKRDFLARPSTYEETIRLYTYISISSQPRSAYHSIGGRGRGRGRGLTPRRYSALLSLTQSFFKRLKLSSPAARRHPPTSPPPASHCATCIRHMDPLHTLRRRVL